MKRLKLTEPRARKLPLPESGQRFAFCSEVKGFGIRCTPGDRSYIVQPRFRGRKVRITLGRVGTLPFEGPADAPGARDLAIVAITAARRGEDPRTAVGQRRQPEGFTLAQVWAAYQEAGFPLLHKVGHKRASTIAGDIIRYRRHVGPRLGAKAVAEIDTAMAQRWLDRIKGLGQRNQCLLLLKALVTFARIRKLAATNTIEIRSKQTRQMQTYLAPEQLRALDAACVELAVAQPPRMAGFIALRVLLHTGARLSEILSAQRGYFDPENATVWLPTHKGGDDGREILLSPAAVAALSSLPITSSPYLFPSRAKGGHMVNLNGHADDAFARAGLKRVRLHDLRHSFASAAVADGVPLFTLRALLGHKSVKTTERYSHLSREHKRDALDRITAAINGSAP